MCSTFGIDPWELLTGRSSAADIGARSFLAVVYTAGARARAAAREDLLRELREAGS